jgi:hypothetical protein
MAFDLCGHDRLHDTPGRVHDHRLTNPSSDVSDDGLSLRRHDHPLRRSDQVRRGQHLLICDTQRGQDRRLIDDRIWLQRCRPPGDHLLEHHMLDIRRPGKKPRKIQTEEALQAQQTGSPLIDTEEAEKQRLTVGSSETPAYCLRYLTSCASPSEVLCVAMALIACKTESRTGRLDTNSNDTFPSAPRKFRPDLPELRRETADCSRQSGHGPRCISLRGRVLELPIHHTVRVLQTARPVVLGKIDNLFTVTALSVIRRNTFNDNRSQRRIRTKQRERLSCGPVIMKLITIPASA